MRDLISMEFRLSFLSLRHFVGKPQWWCPEMFGWLFLQANPL